MYTVDFQGGLLSLDRPVPFQQHGQTAEWALREVETRDLGRAVQGRAVRAITELNAIEILMRGSAEDVNVTSAPSVAEQALSREIRLVERLERSARFRDQVLREYSFRCALTGLAAKPAPASRLSGLIEAAHIKPVSAQGPDVLQNGLALTPTVHRLFDAGFIGLKVAGSVVRLVTSPELSSDMTVSSSGTDLGLENGRLITLPERVMGDAAFNDYVAHHGRSVFRH